MNIDMDASNSDEYFVTALHIFDYCGADSSGTLRVDALMDKFAPFVKTNKSEYSYLRSLLDPEHDNPEIDVTKLAQALNKYSESQKAKVDHDESFNLLKSGQAPQDSDSGISTDGFQIVEELQCELREKAHLAHQLRSQLDFTDRQHEETLAAISAEKEQLRIHLNMLREENAALSDVRRDYEETCERLSVCELALADSRRELDSHKKRSKVLHEQVAMLENEKLTLQEQLSKSKDECHRINEMYASRQSTLLEQNDTLKTEHADLSARLQDQEEFMQQMIKEKVLLEMELKDLLNKSNHTALRIDRSIEISYTEDQMLTALDTLNADSQFSQDNCILDEESFINALREDQGRGTNMSLFDEIRLSFCNVSRHNQTNENITCDKFDKSLDTSMTTVGTQTDNGYDNSNNNSQYDKLNCDKCIIIDNASIYTQTDDVRIDETCIACDRCNLIGDLISISTQTECDIKYAKDKSKDTVPASTQTIPKNYKDKYCQCVISNKVTGIAVQTDEYNNNLEIECMNCIEYEKIYSDKLEKETKRYFNTISGLENDLEKCEDNLDLLQKSVIEGEEENRLLKDTLKGLKAKLCESEDTCKIQMHKIASLCRESCSAECQTECDTASTGVQVEMPCTDCVKRNVAAPQRTFRRYLWESLKCLFQVFAVVCFLCAVSVLYGVSRRGGGAGCARGAVPWQWLGAQDLVDLLLRIEYVADVPM